MVLKYEQNSLLVANNGLVEKRLMFEGESINIRLFIGNKIEDIF